MARWKITAKAIITPEKVIKKGNVVILNKKIEEITEGEVNTGFSVDLSDAVVTSGLINGHDHLVGNYYPKVGNGPYESWLPWDNDLKSSPVYQERQQIENRDLYQVAGYRNLISGCIFVHDHIPHFVQDPFLPEMPLKVISEYALAHSIGYCALNWGDGIEVEYQKAIREDAPFITHISEGFDEETRQNVKTLDRLGGLGENSVLVHGLAFSDEDRALIKRKGASVVWCADSNIFMFNTTTDIAKLLDSGINTCIGTDSPMSGGLNILSELKFDKDYFQKKYGRELSDKILVKMVTENPAKAFRLKNTGVLKEGYLADFVAFADNGDPYHSVVGAELADVKLVVIDGKPVYGDAKYRDLFEELSVDYQELYVSGVHKLLVGDLLGVLDRINRAVGFKKKLPFLPVEPV